MGIVSSAVLFGAFSLLLWMTLVAVVRHGGLVADSLAATVDRAAPEEHVGRHGDSRSIQRCWICGCHQRSRQVVPVDRLSRAGSVSNSETLRIVGDKSLLRSQRIDLGCPLQPDTSCIGNFFLNEDMPIS